MAERSTASGTTTRLAGLLLAGLGFFASAAPAATFGSPSGAPVISGNPAGSIVAGSLYDFRPTASDPNGDPLTFSINRLPRWARFESTTGRFYGTPALGDIGRVRDIVISVSDGTYRKSLPRFSIRVLSGSAPTISGSPPTSVTEGTAYFFQPVASDADGQTLRYSIVNKPSWAGFDTATGRLYGTPGPGSAGTYAGVGISVTDGAYTASLSAFTTNVTASQNSPPTIGGTPAASVEVGKTYDFQPAAADADGDALSFSVVNLPPWASFSPTTGRITGTLRTGNEGTYPNIVVSVSDATDVAFLPMFTITVSAVQNTPPTIAGTPATSVTVGQSYSFQPTATDPDGQSLAFGIANRPGWAAFDTTTGRLSGTPPTGSAGTYANVVISVSDGVASVTLPAFSITVSTANRPPSISGTPAASVTVGQSYSFQPTATDPDGQALTFSIVNRPAWAAFSTTTGRLSGTPAAADAGTYGNIVISVSDGQASTQLPAFAITASQVSTGTATISWQPPTLNADGTPLTNLAGFWIRYGTSSNTLGSAVQVANPGVTSAVIESLSAGTWYFAVTAYNTLGVESDLSQLAQKTIQ